MACICCGQPGAPCTEGICAETGCLCVTAFANYRNIFVTFDTDCTDPCLGVYNPLHGGNCDPRNEIAQNNYQMNFCCDYGTNDNKIAPLFYRNELGYFTAGAGGLSLQPEFGVACINNRLLLWFAAERSNHYFSNYPDVGDQQFCDLGPMPANCSDINGLTGSGTIYWRNLWDANCGVSRPFTATISTDCNATYSAAVGCA